MNRSKRLEPVQRISEQREKDAARAMGECQQRLQQLQQQLGELERYREEYRHHYHENGRNGFSAQRLQQLQQFLSKIDQAIAQQHQAIGHASNECEQKRQQWFRARSRSQALGKVAERYQDVERQEQNRREQKENDEYATRPSGLTKK